MKRTFLVAFLLAASFAFAQQQPNSLDPHPIGPRTVPQQNTTPVPPKAPAQDQIEAGAFVNATKITDPVQKCSALESFFNSYPNSNFKRDGLGQELTACEQSENSAMTQDVAERLIALDPNNRTAAAALQKLKDANDLADHNAKPPVGPPGIALTPKKDTKATKPGSKTEVAKAVAPVVPATTDQAQEDKTPPPMDKLPAIAPQVTYQNGMVTVVASNSNLFETVKAVTAASGIRLVRNGQANEERVSVQIGPAIPREVLLALLTGSRYDFVMMGAGGDADRIDRLVVTPKVAPVGAPNPGGEVAANNPNGQPNARPAVVVEDSDDSEGFAAPQQQQQPQPMQRPIAAPSIPNNNQTPAAPPVPRSPRL